ncbi:uncharacterized protein PpBr36_10504 [Pyricularia pennisetigena]|uniref:uncharacterized protein n=1 Tax=Pyricularia pennisetigena TaxID=1578925 RepID=UPI00114E31CA|nr:uncharacterized protein PpBr36_10504 [Pyricularia pennisetigena]TLS21231.1 hypothetical protein PpBr36_10504 [Pyricularia pennisetigena]
MKFSISLLAVLAPAAMGHYMFQGTIVGGAKSSNWQFIRETANNPSQSPIEDINSPQMACFEKTGRAAAGVQTVSAGSRIGFSASSPVIHPGPFMFYMAQVPDGQDVDSWKPSGNVWFKIDQYGAKSRKEFESGMSEFYTTIPVSLKAANYLLRAEHVGLHSAGNPQFYLSCAQLKVTGNGASSPTDLVSFPGAYSKSDKGLYDDIWVGSATEYTYPGPAIWGGGGSGGSGSGGSGGGNSSSNSNPTPSQPQTNPTQSSNNTNSTPSASTPSNPPANKPSGSPASTPSNSSSNPSTGSCASMYGQCGGQNWAGATCCSSGTCTKSNDYYSQCL